VKFFGIVVWLIIVLSPTLYDTGQVMLSLWQFSSLAIRSDPSIVHFLTSSRAITPSIIRSIATTYYYQTVDVQYYSTLIIILVFVNFYSSLSIYNYFLFIYVFSFTP